MMGKLARFIMFFLGDDEEENEMKDEQPSDERVDDSDAGE